MAGVTEGTEEDGLRNRRGTPKGEGGTEGRSAYLKLAALVALVAGGLLLARLTPVGDLLSREGIGRVLAFLRGSVWAPVLFIALYALATALAVPGTILTLAGGALFGLFWGTIYNSIAANLGANAAFGIARLLGREGIEKLTGDRLEKLDRATREHGFRGLLTLRLIPLVPFNALNFGSGLTAMSWGSYALATVVGILPGTIVYTMFADALLAGSTEASREAFIRVAVSGGLLILLSFLPTILKRLHVKLPGTTAILAVAFLLSGPGPAGADLPAAPSAQDLPDHSAFTTLLQDVVDGNRVDYAGLQAREQELDAYLERLAAVTSAELETAPEDARLAFWINAYNACMLDLVVEHYPIREASGLLNRLKSVVTDRPANSVWQIEDVFTGEHCRVAGEPRSQDEIEHEIIRPMGDPRIHFAVNCAALSCPSLAAEAYTGEALDGQLDRQVHLFLDDPKHFTLEDGPDPVVRLNKVLDWYKEDFGGVEGLRDFLAPYLPPETAETLRDPGTTIRFVEYDWTLNDAGV